MFPTAHLTTAQSPVRMRAYRIRLRTLQGRVVEETFFGSDSVNAQMIALEKYPAASFLFIASGQ